MAAALILQLAGVGLDDYYRVSGLMNIDQKTGTGDWPDGLLTHAAGITDEGLTVIEVWESRDKQGRFMQERLGPAMQKGGVTAVPKATWVDLETYTQIQGAATH
jgi:hypothetical protein